MRPLATNSSCFRPVKPQNFQPTFWDEGLQTALRKICLVLFKPSPERFAWISGQQHTIWSWNLRNVPQPLKEGGTFIQNGCEHCQTSLEKRSRKHYRRRDDKYSTNSIDAKTKGIGHDKKKILDTLLQAVGGPGHLSRLDSGTGTQK